jgi:thiamine-phosphate pyrophosphorylase
METTVARILDANFNRVSEGLRVAEDYARFAVEVPALAEKLKTARHRVRAISALDGAALTRERDTLGDCGSTLKTADENTRADARAVAQANLRRATEGLRVLAEFAKIDHPAAAAELEKIRYELYAWEALLLADNSRRARLQQAQLYVLITSALASTDAVTCAREVVAGGAAVVQLREKQMEDAEFYHLAIQLREICGAAALFILNDRAQLANLVGADGVHTGQGDLPIHLTRRLVGNELLIGKSTAAPEFAARAAAENADYIGVGPLYPTATKVHRAAVGLPYAQWAAQAAPLPYFCIGGVTRERLPAILATGARAVAVCTAIIGARDIAAETAWFKEQLTAAAPPLTKVKSWR